MTKKGRAHLCLIFLLGVVLLVVLILALDPLKTPTLNNQESGWGPILQSASLKHNHGNKLFNITFKYSINPQPCSNKTSLAIIIVTSHYNNVEVRSAMRRAFPREDLAELGLQRVFLLGNARTNQAAVRHESKRFGDIVQGDFVEAYRNLTYKHLMGLKWASENCKDAKYIMKMDDDIVINVRRVANLLESMLLPNKTIAGYVFRGMTPIREPANKWYVTHEEYPHSKYPPFVSGWFYITSPRVASKLLLLSHYFSYFWIDDVFITGVLARNLRLQHYNLKQYFTVFPEFLQCCMAGVEKKLDCDILIGPNGGDNNLFYKFNKIMNYCEGGKCKTRKKPLNETCVAERKVNLNKGNGVIENYKLH